VFVVVLFLILAGWGKLLQFSLYAGPLFVLFAALFLIALSALRESQLLYPIVALGLCGYYLTLSAAAVPTFLFPTLFLPILLIVWVFGAMIVRSLNSRRILFSTGYVSSSFFLGVVAVQAIRGLITQPIFAAVPLLGSSGFYIERYVCGRRTVPGYFGLVLFYTGLVLLISGIPRLPFGYMGLPLLSVTAGIMAFATKVQDRLGFGKLAPVYITGVTSSVVALGLSSVSADAFLITALGFSFHLFGFSKTLAFKPTASRLWEMVTYKTSFALANLAGVGAAVLVIISSFPFKLVTMVVCAGYALFYSLLGMRRTRTLLKTRSLYIYTAGFFSLFLYFRMLTHFLPARIHLLTGILGAPLLALVFLLARSVVNRQPVVVKSIYDLGYPIVVTSFVLPVVLVSYSPLAVLLVGVASLAVYAIFWAFTRERGLLFQLIPVGLFLFMSVATLLGVRGHWLPLAFVVPGVILLSLALISKETGSFASRLCYASFFLASVFSIALSVVDARWLNLYPIAVWGVSYLVAGTVLERRLSYA